MAYRILFIVFLLLQSCQSEKSPLKGETEWQRNMNGMFKDASKSPLLENDLRSFVGLQFFPVDSAFVVNADLRRTPDTEFFNMRTTTDAVNRERVFGQLHFKLKGQNFVLNVYQGEETISAFDNRDYLFLPFLDDTNGEETYGGGRYLDLKIPEGDSITIDFNKAYHPYCVYNERYSCPIVPRENYLATRVEAGIRL
ncbi:MAG: DUF1684 domain-containing protein [Flavobacteriaceae bacterium]|nr:DUF1684 domain-containing protein [Bacteroidia bacterium]MBT8286435.1 DUF1684 domain-containing protein [Bacteroidia bacterium]NNF75711.1 DUF1684 domain-containing protein [Flavobacteriaceae bacterium]